MHSRRLILGLICLTLLTIVLVAAAKLIAIVASAAERDWVVTERHLVRRGPLERLA